MSAASTVTWRNGPLPVVVCVQMWSPRSAGSTIPTVQGPVRFVPLASTSRLALMHQLSSPAEVKTSAAWAMAQPLTTPERSMVPSPRCGVYRLSVSSNTFLIRSNVPGPLPS